PALVADLELDGFEIAAGVCGHDFILELRSAAHRRMAQWETPARLFGAIASPFAPQDAPVSRGPCAVRPKDENALRPFTKSRGRGSPGRPGRDVLRCVGGAPRARAVARRKGYPAWSPSRARLSVLPSTASTSKIPGEVVRPVSAARSGCATERTTSPGIFEVLAVLGK